MQRFAHLAQRLFNTPLAIRPEKAELIVASLASRLGWAQAIHANGSPLAMDIPDEFTKQAKQGRDTILNGVAIVPVYGTLVQKLGTAKPFSGMTGYDGIRSTFLSAMNNSQAKAVMLDIDSPGGEVAGCFDLCDMIYSARGDKPIWAVLNESAYSAAYAIASSANVITVPRTGGTGSVGVITMHCDLSKALDASGMKISIIQYGSHKSDGNETEPLSGGARERIQADVDLMGELFVDTVARNRGMSTVAVRATQASTFLGKQGVDVGFADAVHSPDWAFNVLVSGITDK